MKLRKHIEAIESDVLSTELFITDRIDLLDEEISSNMGVIGLSKELAELSSVEIWLALLETIKRTASRQLDDVTDKVDLKFYLWFDEMAGQLRYNFINAKHDKLPFNCALNLTNSEAEVIELFLKSNTLDGILWDDLEEANETNGGSEVEYILTVYQEIIEKRNAHTPNTNHNQYGFPNDMSR